MPGRIFSILAAAGLCPFAAWCDTTPLFSRTLGGGPSDFITSIVLDPSGNILAAGVAYSPDLPVTNGSRNPGTQFSVSTDHGATWGPLSNLPSGAASALVFSPADSKVVYAGGSAGLFRSTDGGAAWTATSLTSAVISLAADPKSPLGVYAGTTAGLFHSADGGTSWTDITNGFPKPADIYQPLYLVLDPFHPGTIYAGTNLVDVRSTDDGATWSVYQLPGAGNAVHIAPVFDPLHAGVIYAGDTWGLLRSVDGGQTWSVLNVPLVQPQAIAALPGGLWVCGFDGLIYSSVDGGATFTLIQAVGNQRYWGMAVDPFRTSTILTFDFRTSDNGATWQPITLGRSGIYAFDPALEGRVIALANPTADAFVAKLDPTGQKILFATYLGGLGDDAATGIASDPTGNIYVTVTGPSSFAAKFDPLGNLLYSVAIPVAFPRAMAADAQGSALIVGRDCVVLKLSADGTQTVFSTAIPNATQCSGIAVDAAGNAVVAGSILARLDAAGNVISTTSLGGSKSDVASAVALDPDGNIYVTGSTSSVGFPVTSGAYQSALATNCPYPTGVSGGGFLGPGPMPSYETANAFVVKLDPSAQTSIYATYVGGNCLDTPTSIAVDRAGNAWIAGTSDSSTFPQIWPVDSPPPYGQGKAFLTRIAASGAWLWRSTFIAAGTAPVVAADPAGNAYAGGAGTILLKVGPH
jgi:photosystem II stability/assembly factor-like uncharacterized protein